MDLEDSDSGSTSSMDAHSEQHSSQKINKKNSRKSRSTSKLVHFNHPLLIKLEEKNYVLWQRQVLAAIKGHNLMKFLEVDAMMTGSHFAGLDENEASAHWEQQDQLITSWLLSAISENILTLVIECEQSWQIWHKLDEYFASHTRARVQQLRSELRTISKGTKPIAEYLLRIKSLVNALVSVGSGVSEDEYAKIILGGLPAEYQDGSSSGSGFRGTFRGRGRGGFRGGRGRGRGRFSGRSGSSVICQLCNKPGHTCFNCWHRYEQDFQPSPAPPPPYAHLTTTHAPSYGSTPTQPPVRTSHPTNFQTTVVATPESVADPNWHPDTGATAHVTPSFDNLMHSSPYYGQDQVHVGNGQGF